MATQEMRGRLVAQAFLNELEKIANAATAMLRPVGEILAPAHAATLRAKQVAQAVQPTVLGRLGIFPGPAGRAFRHNLGEARTAVRSARADLRTARQQATSELGTPGIDPARHDELTRYLGQLNQTQRPTMPGWRLQGAPPTPTKGEQVAGGVRRAAMVGVPLALGGGALAYAGSNYLSSKRDPYAQ